jgi:hypothetical protein
MLNTLKTACVASLLVATLAGPAAAQYGQAQPPSPPLPRFGGEHDFGPYRNSSVNGDYRQFGNDLRAFEKMERMDLERNWNYGTVPVYGSLPPPPRPLPPYLEPLPWGPPQSIPQIRYPGPGYGPRDPSLRLPPPVGY